MGLSPILPHMTNREAPLQAVEEALGRGFEVEEVRSDRSGVTVDLCRGETTETIRFSPEEARRIVEGAEAPRPSAP